MPRLLPEQRKQVGTMSDGCGAVVKVYQNAKDHLYTICPNCGCDQRNGAEPQTAMYRALIRLPGVDMVRPPRAAAGVEPLGAVPVEPGATPAVAGDFVPEETPISVAATTDEPKEKNRSGALGFLLFALGVAGLIFAGTASPSTR